MIKVQRAKIPRALERHQQRWTTALLQAKTESERSRAESKYRHRDVQLELCRMFHGKCAYCESFISHVDYGKIEHFRPKRGKNARPDLTFDWENLLWACGRCNGPGQKADHFPEAADGGPIVNPCDDDPSQHFRFEYDRVAKVASVYGITPRGEVSEKLLGLNRHELRAYRSKKVRSMMALSLLAKSDAEAASLLAEALQVDNEYTAFMRALFI